MPVIHPYLADGFRSLYCKAMKEMVYGTDIFGSEFFMFGLFFLMPSDSGRL